VLGEGALWCPREQRLWWIDISKPSLWSWRARTREVEHWPLPKPPGSFALRERGGFLFAFRSGLATLEKQGAEPKWLEGLELGDERFNDGKTDRAGP
jgi:sugar lactone lactonase YvrE